MNLTYIGPPVDDRDTLSEVPAELRALLEARNGFIAYDGGLHVRGACREPIWHSLGHWWRSEQALFRHFPAVAPTDVPFAEDAMGDQFLLRDSEVYRLQAETGGVESLGVGLRAFLEAADSDPIGFLALQPLLAFGRQGGTLAPGQLLSVYPPFAALESQNGVSMQAVAVADRIGALAQLAQTIGGLADGTRFRTSTTD